MAFAASSSIAAGGRAWPVVGLSVCILAAMCLCSCGPAPAGDAWSQATPAGQWGALFDGKTLAGWKVPVFGGDGKVYVKGGAIHMEMGQECTGVTYTGPLARENYEIDLEGMRVDGTDFFCGLTLPVGKDPITLILGGWGGTVVGLSCIDYSDASQNETTQEVYFDNGQWYSIRVRVTKPKIQVWLDDKKIIDVDRAGRKITIRPEVDLSVPLGIATWKTHGAARNIRMRTLETAEP